MKLYIPPFKLYHIEWTLEKVQTWGIDKILLIYPRHTYLKIAGQSEFEQQLKQINLITKSIDISIKLVPLTIEKSNQILEELIKFRDF